MKIQIVILDERDMILEYKDFTQKDKAGIAEYIAAHLAQPQSVKIHIRKWKV